MLQLLTAEIQTEMHEKETQLSLDAFMLNHPGSSIHLDVAFSVGETLCSDEQHQVFGKCN